MTHADFAAFTKTFHDVVVTLARRLDDADEAQMLTVYFSALRSYPLAQVQAGAAELLRTATLWP